MIYKHQYKKSLNDIQKTVIFRKSINVSRMNKFILYLHIQYLLAVNSDQLYFP